MQDEDKIDQIQEPKPGQYVDRCHFSKTGWGIWEGNRCTCVPVKEPDWQKEVPIMECDYPKCSCPRYGRCRKIESARRMQQVSDERSPTDGQPEENETTNEYVSDNGQFGVGA